MSAENSSKHVSWQTVAIAVCTLAAALTATLAEFIRADLADVKARQLETPTRAEVREIIADRLSKAGVINERERMTIINTDHNGDPSP